MKTLREFGVKQLFIFFILMSTALTATATEPAAKASEPMTMQNFVKELIRNDIKHWKVVFAQGIVESGWNFDSYLFQQTNNFCGMRVPRNRPSTRIGEFKNYSKYATWQDCVKDIKHWQDQNWKGGTQEEYIDFMQKIWAESPDYRAYLYMVIEKIDRMVARLREQHKGHFNYNVIMAYVSQ